MTGQPAGGSGEEAARIASTKPAASTKSIAASDSSRVAQAGARTTPGACTGARRHPRRPDAWRALADSTHGGSRSDARPATRRGSRSNRARERHDTRKWRRRRAPRDGPLADAERQHQFAAARFVEGIQIERGVTFVAQQLDQRRPAFFEGRLELPVGDPQQMHLQRFDQKIFSIPAIRTRQRQISTPFGPAPRRGGPLEKCTSLFALPHLGDPKPRPVRALGPADGRDSGSAALWLRWRPPQDPRAWRGRPPPRSRKASCRGQPIRAAPECARLCWGVSLLP